MCIRDRNRIVSLTHIAWVIIVTFVSKVSYKLSVVLQSTLLYLIIRSVGLRSEINNRI